MGNQCEDLQLQVKKFLADGVAVHPTKDEGCLVQLPFKDSDGDPIHIAAYRSGNTIILNDAGMVAGTLFTLGQHTQDTPAFKLLRNLEKAYGFKLDFDRGQITIATTESEMLDVLTDFSKVIITMLTAIPHVRVEPHRLKPLGQRLRIKIKKQLESPKKGVRNPKSKASMRN